jgi:hypothetical protein
MPRFLSLLRPILLTWPLVIPALAREPPRADPSAPHRPRQTWEQHFDQANLAHDGHLTAAQANGGYAVIARHFEEVDADHKGYVTEADIKAWRLTHKAVRRTPHRLAKRPLAC